MSKVRQGSALAVLLVGGLTALDRGTTYQGDPRDGLFAVLAVAVAAALWFRPSLLHPRLTIPAVGTGVLAVVLIDTDALFAAFAGATLLGWWAAHILSAFAPASCSSFTSASRTNPTASTPSPADLPHP